MTSTSREPVVMRDLPDGAVTLAPMSGDLRGGRWTRLGRDTVHGDRVTEASLATLAERSRAAAQAEGYAAGWAEGRRAAIRASAEATDRDATLRARERQQRAAAAAATLTALTEVSHRLEEQFARNADHLAAQAVGLALEVAAAVLGRELAVASDPGSEALVRALALVPADAAVTVRLHPDDLAGLDGAADLLVGRAVRLVADPTIARGGALAENDALVVDATVAAALDRVREVLTR